MTTPRDIAETVPETALSAEGFARSRPKNERRRLPRPAILNNKWARGILSITLGLALWELFVKLSGIDPLLLTPPSVVLPRLIELIGNGELITDIRVSAAQFGLGYSVAALVGIPLGLFLGMSRIWNDLADPWVQALYVTPAVALAPLFVIWFGYGLQANAAIVAFLSFFPILISTTTGVRQVEPDYLEVANVYRANRFERFCMVLLPGSMSYVFAGLRLGAGRGIIGIVVGDLFGSRAGLGHLIWTASQTFRTADIFVGSIVLALGGILVTACLYLLEITVSPWRRTLV